MHVILRNISQIMLFYQKMETDFKEFEEAQKMVWDILYDVGIYFDFNAYNI